LKQDLYYDGDSEGCDVELEPEEVDQFWDNNDMSNISNKSQDNEESIVELNPDNLVDFDILFEEQLNDDNGFAKVVNGARIIKNEKNQNKAISMEMEAAIELLSLLWKLNASFQLYSKIVKWAKHFFQELHMKSFHHGNVF